MRCDMLQPRSLAATLNYVPNDILRDAFSPHLGAHAVATSIFEHLGTLLRTQPVAGAKPKLLDPFHSADSSGQFGTEQSRIGGLVSEPSHGCEL
jgi:hypothetical protein